MGINREIRAGLDAVGEYVPPLDGADPDAASPETASPETASPETASPDEVSR